MNISPEGIGAFSVQIREPTFQAERAVVVQPDGSKVVYNRWIEINEYDRGKGIGTTVFTNQVGESVRQGISRIETFADRGPNLNGYYVWPLFGYDGMLPTEIRSTLPPSLSSALTIQQLYALPGGPNWWQEFGQGIDLTFDLRPGSRSLQVLDAYLREKRRRLAGATGVTEAIAPLTARLESPEEPERGEEPDLSEEDWDIMRAVWRGIE